jgi:hypothetical protein
VWMMRSVQYRTEENFFKIKGKKDALIRKMETIAGVQAALTIVARSDFDQKRR